MSKKNKPHVLVDTPAGIQKRVPPPVKVAALAFLISHPAGHASGVLPHDTHGKAAPCFSRIKQDPDSPSPPQGGESPTPLCRSACRSGNSSHLVPYTAAASFSSTPCSCVSVPRRLCACVSSGCSTHRSKDRKS